MNLSKASSARVNMTNSTKVVVYPGTPVKLADLN